MNLLILNSRAVLDFIADALDLDALHPHYPLGASTIEKLQYLQQHPNVSPEMAEVFAIAERGYRDLIQHPLTSKLDLRQLEAFLLGVLRTLEAQSQVEG